MYRGDTEAFLAGGLASGSFALLLLDLSKVLWPAELGFLYELYELGTNS